MIAMNVANTCSVQLIILANKINIYSSLANLLVNLFFIKQIVTYIRDPGLFELLLPLRIHLYN